MYIVVVQGLHSSTYILWLFILKLQAAAVDQAIYMEIFKRPQQWTNPEWFSADHLKDIHICMLNTAMLSASLGV